jgi:peptide/nickel transport system ATP-binding protein
VHQGERVGILGESGCGKTTLSRAVVGLLPRDAHISGSIRLQGQEMVGGDEVQWRQVRGRLVTVIPQDSGPALNPVMRVRDQVLEVLRIHSKPPRHERVSAVRALLAAAGIHDLERIERAWPYQLSGGECQRVAIAQAFACAAPLLIADEPTASLDTVTARRVLDTLRELVQRERRALILISHDAALLARSVDRVVVLRDGVVVEDGDALSVLCRPRSEYTSGLVRDAC